MGEKDRWCTGGKSRMLQQEMFFLEVGSFLEGAVKERYSALSTCLILVSQSSGALGEEKNLTKV